MGRKLAKNGSTSLEYTLKWYFLAECVTQVDKLRVG